MEEIRKTKIAIVSTMNLPTPAIRGGAVETLTTHLIEENEKQINFDIDLYTIYDEKLKEYSYQKTTIIPIKVNLMEKWFQKLINLKNRLFGKLPTYNISYTKLARKIKKQVYDLIVIENNMFVYKIVQRNVAVPLVYHIHNDFNEVDKTKENYKQVAQTAKKILTVSNYIKNRCNSVIDMKNVEVLYNCIDDQKYQKSDTINMRSKYQIEDNAIVVGYVGRITQEKGILELIKAIKKVKTEKNIKLLIVGAQWYSALIIDDYMKQIAEEIKGIEDKIIFLGYIEQENMANIYEIMDIVAVPSLCEEAFGCVAIEAMAMGKPVVVAESGGLPEIVKESFGFVIPKDEKFTENLAKKLEILINDEELRKEYGKQAKDEFENNKDYHKEQYFRNFVDLISK
ncbi:MAG: glycosyltransferase family 4 protein [Clostridia bacterium]|nr:glycosyltransferase family 4 protein [Clostridia bacterium]